MEDALILRKGFLENWVVFSADKDFGALVFKSREPHRGVVLVRLSDQTISNKRRIIEKLFRQVRPEDLIDTFVVVTEKRIRFFPPKPS